MKRCVQLLLLLCVLCSGLKAQESRFSSSKNQKKNLINRNDSISKLNQDSIFDENGPEIHAWKIDSRFGIRTKTYRDSIFQGSNQRSLVDGQDVAVGYLGNYGSPAQSKIFFDRAEPSLFSFLDPFSFYYKKPEDQCFMNTKQAYSNINYQSAGSQPSKEERLRAEMSINFNKHLNIGLNFDYVYSRGYYSYLSNKQWQGNLYSSYITDRLEVHAIVGNNSFSNAENGGIARDSLLIDPNISSSLDIPVKMKNVWNTVKGKTLFATAKYNLGYTKDSTFVPIASIIYTTHYVDQSRHFGTHDSTTVATGTVNGKTINYTALDTLYNNKYYDAPANDLYYYRSFKNTFALAMNEGFRPWVKFGLTAFIEQDFRKYTIPLNATNDIESYNQSSTVIGGILSKKQGRFLRYNIMADVGVIGYNLGEFRLQGNISTLFSFKGKTAILSANGYIKNLKPTFYQEQYNSKYFEWDHRTGSDAFGDIRKVFLGGEINLPFSGTRLSGGVENIQNYIYYGSDKLIAQEGGSIQVVSFRLDQKLKAGILHWDNQLVYQATSNKTALPLPTFSAYSNLYIQTSIAHTLKIQLGVDTHYTSSYYAPGYDPATLQFYNQQDIKIGNFPVSTAYINGRLKRTRFYVMFYNITSGFGGQGYFTTPHYPINPMIFKFGISWDFAN